MFPFSLHSALALCLVILQCRGGWSCADANGDGEVTEWQDTTRVARRDVSLRERSSCEGGDPQPPERVDTTKRVAALIGELERRGLDAYIITSDDAHMSEYTAAADGRRAFISGQDGSAGTAVVLRDGRRALWTDGRYFLAADRQMDCEWLLMKAKEPGVPTMSAWLAQELPEGGKVAVDGALIAATSFLDLQLKLNKSGLELVAEKTNLVDAVWPQEDRPARVKDDLFVHELAFAGVEWTHKVAQVREEMKKQDVDLLVVTALDEVAWLLNLRGNDIPYNTVFRSYLLVDHKDVTLFIDNERIPPVVDFHLHIGQCFDNVCFHTTGYDNLVPRLQAAAQAADVKRVLLPKKYAYSGGVSYAIYSAVPADKRVSGVSPVVALKARKNDVEAKGMKTAHLRDAVALVDFLAFLEKEVESGREWDELSAAQRLDEYRAEQEHFLRPSFGSISAYGPNGAIVHYRPTNATKLTITKDAPYLLDSGGQYFDGTTDVTRTLHFGAPTELQKEAYTRVLMGAVDLALLVFPKGTSDVNVDVITRRYLYQVGLDYKHGTGHGIGMFLNVHESPIQVRIYGDEKHEFELNHFFSDEPGYYLAGEFGIRLETILRVVRAGDLPYKTDTDFYAFEPVTLVPFEPKFIMLNMLSPEQCKFINDYHHRTRTEVGNLLEKQGRSQGLAYLLKKTEPLECSRARGPLETASRSNGVMETKMESKKKVPPQLAATSGASEGGMSAAVCVYGVLLMVVMMERW